MIIKTESTAKLIASKLIQINFPMRSKKNCHQSDSESYCSYLENGNQAYTDQSMSSLGVIFSNGGSDSIQLPFVNLPQHW